MRDLNPQFQQASVHSESHNSRVKTCAITAPTNSEIQNVSKTLEHTSNVNSLHKKDEKILYSVYPEMSVFEFE
jgi:hypothetical protein